MSYYQPIEHKIIATAPAPLFALSPLPSLVLTTEAPQDPLHEELKILFHRINSPCLEHIIPSAEKLITQQELIGKTPREISIVIANMLWQVLTIHNLEGIGNLVGYIATRTGLNFPEMVSLVIHFVEDIQRTNDSAATILDGTEHLAGFFATFAYGLIDGVGILEVDKDPTGMKAIEASGASPVNDEVLAQTFRDHIYLTTLQCRYSLAFWREALNEGVWEEPNLIVVAAPPRAKRFSVDKD